MFLINVAPQILLHLWNFLVCLVILVVQVINMSSNDSIKYPDILEQAHICLLLQGVPENSILSFKNI